MVISTWGSMRFCSLLEPASSGFHVGFTSETRRSPLGLHTGTYTAISHAWAKHKFRSNQLWGHDTTVCSDTKANRLTLIGPKCSTIRHTWHLHYFQITLSHISTSDHLNTNLWISRALVTWRRWQGATICMAWSQIRHLSTHL